MTLEIYFIITSNKDLENFVRGQKVLDLIRQRSPQEGRNYKILISGKSHFDYNKQTSEARLYADFLIQRGVLQENIILEEESMDTVGNMVFSYPIILKMLEKHPNEEVEITLITENYHLKRAKFLFDRIIGLLMSRYLNIRIQIEPVGRKPGFFNKRKYQEPVQLRAMRRDFEKFKLNDIESIRNYLFSLPVYRKHYLDQAIAPIDKIERKSVYAQLLMRVIEGNHYKE